MSNGLEGGCACGAVRYRLTSAPMFVHCCHCRDCQRQTGSAFVINALIETDRIALLSGDPEPVAMPTDSGRPHDIIAARSVETAMWSDYGRRPALRFVRVGTLDDAAPWRRMCTSSRARSCPGSPCPRRTRRRRLLRHAEALARGQPGAPAGDPGLRASANRAANGEHLLKQPPRGLSRRSFLALYGPVYRAFALDRRGHLRFPA